MKLESMPLLKKTILTLAICMSSIGVNASPVTDRLTTSEMLEIEEHRLSHTPKHVIEQSMVKASYSNDDQYLDRIHKLAYTFPVGIINGGQTVELVDQSKWYVNAVQRRQVCGWVQSDTIFIKPKSSCFSMYPYILYNRTTHEAVEVQFVDMPQYYGIYRQRIAKIDYYNRIVQFDDSERTVWKVSLSDTGFNYWKEGDYIVVGVNNDWRLAEHPHILINTSIAKAPYCEAIFYGYDI